MNKMQQQVTEFHKKYRHCARTTPGLPGTTELKLRNDLINEEYEEYSDAVNDRDIVKIADALADLLYVTLGTCVSFGIDIEPIFDIVHKANMLKSFEKAQTGKTVKGDEWKHPTEAIQLELQRQEKIKRKPPAVGGHFPPPGGYNNL